MSKGTRWNLSYAPPHGLTMLASPCYPHLPNRTTAKSSMNSRHAGWPSELSQFSFPHPTLELNFIWALAFFSVLLWQVKYFLTPSVAPDTMSSSTRSDILEKLAMTFRLVINCLLNLWVIIIITYGSEVNLYTMIVHGKSTIKECKSSSYSHLFIFVITFDRWLMKYIQCNLH